MELQKEIMELHYNTVIVGYLRQWKTEELIKQNYWWPRMSKFIVKYINGCNKCNKMKGFPTAPIGKLMPNLTLFKPWTDILADLIVKLPLSQGHNSILVMVDRHLKITHLIACSEKLSSLGLATLYCNNVWKLHELLSTILSDRGGNFASKLMKELHGLLGVKMKLSSAFHSQTNGQTERMNQEIDGYLHLFFNHC